MATQIKLLDNYFRNESSTCMSSLVSIMQVQVRHRIFSPVYIHPITDKKTVEEMIESGEAQKLAHIPILPAKSDVTCSIYHDPQIKKLTNYLMREGKKTCAQSMVLKAFETVKRFQLTKYHRTTDPEEKANIEVDLIKVFHAAVNNCTPLLTLTPIKRGGATYQVPVPINANKANFIAMNWLVEAGAQKDRKVTWATQIAHELIEASNNKGRVVKRKQELLKQCEANRAYAHYRRG